MENNEGWRIGKIAERAGVTIATLHFYEEKGLITSWRNTGNQRRYDTSVLRRIAVIKSAQGLGIPLKEIQQALSVLPKDKAPTIKDWRKLSTQWRTSLQQRIKQLEQLKDELDQCINCCF